MGAVLRADLVLNKLEGTARYKGKLLSTAKGFCRAKNSLFMELLVFLGNLLFLLEKLVPLKRDKNTH